MKRFSRVFATLGFLIPFLTAGVAKAQDEMLPLEVPTAASAIAIDGLENRQVSTDFDYLFLPPGAGGEQSDETWSYSTTELEPVATEITRNVNQGGLPTYSIVEPNRAIETQTDPQRLTTVVNP